MTIPLRMSYTLVGTGWSRCMIEASDNRLEITASYLSDALGNLVLSALAVVSGFRAAAFPFDEEPGEYRWVLEVTDNNVLSIRVLEFSELWSQKPDTEGRVLFAISTTPLAYAKAVHSCASAVLEEH